MLIAPTAVLGCAIPRNSSLTSSRRSASWPAARMIVSGSNQCQMPPPQSREPVGDWVPGSTPFTTLAATWARDVETERHDGDERPQRGVGGVDGGRDTAESGDRTDPVVALPVARAEERVSKQQCDTRRGDDLVVADASLSIGVVLGGSCAAASTSAGA